MTRWIPLPQNQGEIIRGILAMGRQLGEPLTRQQIEVMVDARLRNSHYFRRVNPAGQAHLIGQTYRDIYRAYYRRLHPDQAR